MSKEDMLAPDFDLKAYLDGLMTKALFDTPDPTTGRTLREDIKRDDARFIYGTNAVKQGQSKHTRMRREKRR